MRWKRYGPDGVLITFAENVGEQAAQRGRALTAFLEQSPPPGLIEFVPSFTTLLLEFDPRVVDDLAAAANDLMPDLQAALKAVPPPAAIREIPVQYDGEDLDRVARCHGLATAEVAELHAAPLYHVYLLGFSPGFPYLGDLDPRLHTPRLPTPRPRVRAGSVAIGGEHTGIYSIDGPGGWNIIGRTPTRLFDPARPDRAMFVLHPGERVKFIPEKRRRA